MLHRRRPNRSHPSSPPCPGSVLPWLLALLAVLAPIRASAQLSENLSSLFDEDNARAYLEPLRKALASGLGSGLAPSGSVARDGAWSLRLSVQSMWIGFDDEDRLYRATPPESFPGDGTTEAPTVIGDSGGAVLTGAGADSLTSFRFPGGFDVDRLALAVPQLTASARGFELTLRWVDLQQGTTELGDLSLFGIGGRYDLTGFLGRDLPVDVAAMAFYQSLEYGEAVIDANLLSYGVQVSRAFGRLEPYSAVTFESFDLDVDYRDGDGEAVVLRYDRDERARLTLGTALHLPYVHLNGELGFSDQFSFTLGLSVGP